MKFVFGMLVGFGVGVAVGLLLAPQSGEDTRSQLSEQGITLADRSKSLTENLRTRATDALRQGREGYQRTRSELMARARSGDL